MDHDIPVLVGLESGFLKGIESLSWGVERLQQVCELSAISTIIQTLQDGYEPQLRVVIKLMSDKNADELLNLIKIIENEFRSNVTSLEQLKVYLLTFNDLVLLTPHLTLPHPILLEKPGWLYCSWEVWKNYRHPVLDQTIERLLSQKPMTNVEFFGQGKAILGQFPRL